jgi:hypothetical protein
MVNSQPNPGQACTYVFSFTIANSLNGGVACTSLVSTTSLSNDDEFLCVYIVYNMPMKFIIIDVKHMWLSSYVELTEDVEVRFTG